MDGSSVTGLAHFFGLGSRFENFLTLSQALHYASQLMASENRKRMPIRTRIWSFLRRTLIPKKYRLKWSTRRTEHEYDHALKKAQATGNRDAMKSIFITIPTCNLQ